MCFDAYDSDKSGHLDYNELKTLLVEMSLHKQFARHYNPDAAFEHFIDGIWRGFDTNRDGKLSYEEFVHIFNTILDR